MHLNGAEVDRGNGVARGQPGALGGSAGKEGGDTPAAVAAALQPKADARTGVGFRRAALHLPA